MAIDAWPQPTIDRLREHIEELVTHRDAIEDHHTTLATTHYTQAEGDDDADASGQ